MSESVLRDSGQAVASAAMTPLERVAFALNWAQILMQGGMNDRLPIEWYEGLLRYIKSNYPTVHIHAFSPPEFAEFERFFGMDVREILRRFKAAGLDTIPGGGGEILVDRVRKVLNCYGKATSDEWLGVMREAHRAGLRTTSTMMYGTCETDEERIEHLVRLRELQDETGGFVTFIPLAFQPWEAPAMKLPETTGFDDLKAIAVARLMLDNVPHVKSYWIMITPRLAQVGLSFGADDIDGTVTEEKIAHDAGAQTPQVMTVHELVRLVREAGRRPLERDTVFNVVREW